MKSEVGDFTVDGDLQIFGVEFHDFGHGTEHTTLVGFVLAAIVLATTLVSFQMLVDRPVGLPAAVVTSLRVARRNPTTVAAWGAIIAGLLVLGAIPALLGLIVVLPVLGHASWHFYRAAVSWERSPIPSATPN